MDKGKKLTYEQTKNKALRILEYRTNSKKEITDKLKRAGAEQENIEKVLEFLEEYHFINDGDFAIRYARDLKTLKKFGKKRIRTELFKKGISEEFIENAIDELSWEEDILSPLVEKKLAGNFEKKSIDRCIRYFLYKGYSYDEIKSALEKVVTEEM